MNCTAVQSDANAGWIVRYREQGYAVLPAVFDAASVASMARAFRRQQAAGLSHGRSFRHGNLFYRVTRDASLGPIVRMAQWPAYVDRTLNQTRRSPQLFGLLEPLLGQDIRQIINQLHWKPPGAAVNDFAFHQDCQFRKPAEAFRNLGESYVQTGIAIDVHDARSGCMRIIPKSHARGDLGLVQSGPVMEQTMRNSVLREAGLDPAHVIDLEMQPGDVALWNPYLVHGSGANMAHHERRYFINGYARAADCDRGEWAFRKGRPARLGAVPALIHFEQIAERPEPHYVDGD